MPSQVDSAPALVTYSLLTQSATLGAELAVVLERSRALLAWGHERRLSTTYPRLRPIAGGADLDAPHIAELIAQSPLCLDCLVKKTGLTIEQTRASLARIQGLLAVTVARGHCEGCLLTTTTYQLGHFTRPDGTPPPLAPTDRPGLTQALWRFLTEHRGQMFCTRCVSSALGASGRLDRVLIAAEGRWARRQHGRCSGCGKSRLLCGLVR